MKRKRRFCAPGTTFAGGDDGGDLVSGVAEGGLVVADFVAEVAQPDDLVADARGVVTSGAGHGRIS